MEGEITRWRIAYDTISALVAVDQSRTGRPQPVFASPSSTAAAAAAAGRSGGFCAAGDTTSHLDDAVMIQRQRRDVAGARMTHQSSVPAAQSNHATAPPTITSLPASNRPRSADPMTSLCGVVAGTELEHGRLNQDSRGLWSESQVSDRQRDDAARLVHDSQALVGLFRRLLDTFYVEALIWMYSNVLLHPAARRTRNRLHWLGVVTGRGLEQAASNVLTGFLAGYRQSRQALNVDVEEVLTTPGSGRAGRLASLAVELGVVLNPRQMMRSFSAVVRDLVFRTSSFQPVLTNTGPSPRPSAGRLYRYITLFTNFIHG